MLVTEDKSQRTKSNVMKCNFIKIHLLGSNFGTVDEQEWGDQDGTEME